MKALPRHHHFCRSPMQPSRALSRGEPYNAVVLRSRVSTGAHQQSVHPDAPLLGSRDCVQACQPIQNHEAAFALPAFRENLLSSLIACPLPAGRTASMPTGKGGPRRRNDGSAGTLASSTLARKFESGVEGAMTEGAGGAPHRTHTRQGHCYFREQTQVLPARMLARLSTGQAVS